MDRRPQQLVWIISPARSVGLFSQVQRLFQNLMILRRHNFRPALRSDDEATMIVWSLRRSDAEAGRKVRRPSGGPEMAHRRVIRF